MSGLISFPEVVTQGPPGKKYLMVQRPGNGREHSGNGPGTVWERPGNERFEIMNEL